MVLENRRQVGEQAEGGQGWGLDLGRRGSAQDAPGLVDPSLEVPDRVLRHEGRAQDHRTGIFYKGSKIPDWWGGGGGQGQAPNKKGLPSSQDLHSGPM